MDSRRVLGVDAKGYTHRWDSVYRKVYVYDGEELMGTFHIGDDPLSDHADKIEKAFGEWETLHLTSHPLGALDSIEVSD